MTREFAMLKSSKVANLLIGAVFFGLGVIWLQEDLANMQSRGMTRLLVNLCLMALGALTLARPFFSRLAVSPTEIIVKDGYMPTHRYPFSEIMGAAYNRRKNKITLALRNQKQAFIEFTYEGFDEFIDVLKQHNIPIQEPDQPFPSGKGPDEK